jgi:hypothetical protein
MSAPGSTPKSEDSTVFESEDGDPGARIVYTGSQDAVITSILQWHFQQCTKMQQTIIFLNGEDAEVQFNGTEIYASEEFKKGMQYGIKYALQLVSQLPFTASVKMLNSHDSSTSSKFH